MGKRIVTILAAASLWAAASVRAELITWTLHEVTFDDGGTASGFFTFDPTVQLDGPSRQRQYLTDFDIKTTAGTKMTAPFEYTPANTDASVPWFVNFFSAPEPPRPRHGLPQHTFRLYIHGRWPATGGRAELLTDASTDELLFGDRAIFRSTTSGFLTGAVVPEPAGFAFLAAGMFMLFQLRALSLRRFLRRRWGCSGTVSSSTAALNKS